MSKNPSLNIVKRKKEIILKNPLPVWNCSNIVSKIKRGKTEKKISPDLFKYTFFRKWLFIIISAASITSVDCDGSVPLATEYYLSRYSRLLFFIIYKCRERYKTWALLNCTLHSPVFSLIHRAVSIKVVRQALERDEQKSIKYV